MISYIKYVDARKYNYILVKKILSMNKLSRGRICKTYTVQNVLDGERLGTNYMFSRTL